MLAFSRIASHQWLCNEVRTSDNDETIYGSKARTATNCSAQHTQVVLDQSHHELDALQRHEPIRRFHGFLQPREEDEKELPLVVLRDDHEGALDLAQIQQLARRIAPGPRLAEETADRFCELGLRDDDGVQALGDAVEGGLQIIANHESHQNDGSAEQAENRLQQLHGKGSDEVPRAKTEEKLEVLVEAKPEPSGVEIGTISVTPPRVQLLRLRVARVDDELRKLAHVASLLVLHAQLHLIEEHQVKCVDEVRPEGRDREIETAQELRQVELLLLVVRVEFVDDRPDQNRTLIGVLLVLHYTVIAVMEAATAHNR